MTYLAVSGKTLSKRARRTFFRHWPKPPWTCVFCGDEIWTLGGTRWSLVVHHLDRNRYNNKLKNLKPAHHSCHARYHQLERLKEAA